MNRFGRAAQRHWQQYLPSRYAQIPDPEEFFSTLGEQMETETQDLAASLAGPDPAGEGYLAKVGRLNAARQAAEEAVLAETAFPPPENQELDQQPDQELDQEPDQLADQLPDEDVEQDGPSVLASVQAAIAEAQQEDPDGL